MDSRLEKAVHNFVFTAKFLEVVKKAEYRNKDKKKTARCSMAITTHKKENARWSMGRNIP